MATPTTLRVTIDHAIRMPKHADVLAELKKRLSFPNPAREALARRGQHPGRVPETWCAVEASQESGEVVVPRGALPHVIEALRAAGVTPEWQARVTYDRDAVVTPLDQLAVQGRDYQVEAVEKCAAQRQGVVGLPCGGGKTMVGALLTAHLGQRAVVCCPTTDIRDQWVETLRRVSGGKLKIRVIGGDVDWSGVSLSPREVAVGVDDSLASDRAVPMLRSAGLLIFDECHRLASKTWRAIVGVCAARWRIGFTATPERADGWDLLLPLLLGPVLLERSQRWLVEQGYLAQPTVYALAVPTTSSASDFVYRVMCGSCGRESSVDPDKVKTGLLKCKATIGRGSKRDVCNAPIAGDAQVSKTFNTGKAGSRVAKDPARVGLVLDMVRWAHARGRVVLVLLGRVSAVPVLVRELAGHGIEAVGLTGKEPRPKRAEALRRVRAGHVRVVVATTVADEGLDLPEADTLVSANPGKASGATTQRVGRICRPKGLEPLVFDVVDGGSNYARQWSARSSAYRKAYGDVAVPHRRPLSWSEVLAVVERKQGKVGGNGVA